MIINYIYNFNELLILWYEWTTLLYKGFEKKSILLIY